MVASRSNQGRSAPKPTPDLMFVSITRPEQIKDRNTQRKINRHVMKPIGMARRRKPRNDKTEPTLGSENTSLSTALMPRQTDDDLEYASNAYRRNMPSPMGADEGLSHRHFSNRARKIISFLREGDSPVCVMMRELCFTLAMINDSAMHVALALTSLFTQERRMFLLQEFDTSLEHYNASVGLVSKQITNIGNTACEALMGVVATLACYDLCTYHLDRWVVHMLGLKRLLEIRGGLDKIESRYLQVTLVWSDLTGSMMADSPSKLKLCPAPPERQSASHALNTITAKLEKRLPNHADLCTFLRSVCGFTTTARGKPKWANDPTLNKELQSLVSMMLSLPRHDVLDIQDDENALHETIRLASLFFLSGPAVMIAGNKFGNRTSLNHQGRLPMLLREQNPDWTGLEDLELWVLVIAALVETGEDQAWILGQINYRLIARELSWDDVLGVLAQIAWVDALWIHTLDDLRADLQQTFGFSR